MSEFQLSTDDIEDIIDFCKNNTPKTRETVLCCEYSDNKKETCNKDNGLEFTFRGDSLRYVPIQTENQEGLFLKIILANNNQLMYQYIISSCTTLNTYYSIGMYLDNFIWA